MYVSRTQIAFMHSTPVNSNSYLFTVPYDEKQFNSDLVLQLELTLFDCVKAVMVDHENRFYFADMVCFVVKFI